MVSSVEKHRAVGRGSLNLAVLTVSDTRTLETDVSGALIEALAVEAGHLVVSREIVPDEPVPMTSLLRGFRVPGRSRRRAGDRRHGHQPA